MSLVTFWLGAGVIQAEIPDDIAAGLIETWQVGGWISFVDSDGKEVTINSGMLAAISIGPGVIE